MVVLLIVKRVRERILAMRMSVYHLCVFQTLNVQIGFECGVED